MRELDRNPTPTRCAIVGAGRLGTALATALRATGLELDGPLARGEALPAEVDAVLLCVPDAEIGAAATTVPAGVLAGHCSGANGLGVLDGHEGFSLHPLTTVTTGGAARFEGAGAAVAGSTTRALAFALDLAGRLGMRATIVDDADRAAYHAAASIASNFLVTLEAAAERIGATAGVDRAMLVPLVEAAVANWAALGPAGALTGPIARGDAETVARQRTALEERTPDLLALFDALAAATRELALEAAR